jgi:hypothetical protein
MRKHQVGAVFAGIACVTALVLGWTVWPPTNVASAQGGDQPKFTPEQAKALEDWSYALALDAANWGCPAVIFGGSEAGKCG